MVREKYFQHYRMVSQALTTAVTIATAVTIGYLILQARL